MTSNTIIGAIAGDIIGYVFEFNNLKSTEFDLFSEGSDFTDDTVLTIAVADCILNKKDFSGTIKDYGKRFYGRGYGGNFEKWLYSTYNYFSSIQMMHYSNLDYKSTFQGDVF